MRDHSKRLTLRKWCQRPWHTHRWMGHLCIQTPVDMALMQELITEHRPQLLIEAGTCYGGHALFLRHMQTLNGIDNSHVVTIDIEERPGRPQYANLHYWTADTTTVETANRLDGFIELRNLTEAVTFVILDSAHDKDHVLRELHNLSRFVQPPGAYLIVEDGTAVSGPTEAVNEFLTQPRGFRRDGELDRFGLSNHRGGWLRKA